MELDFGDTDEDTIVSFHYVMAVDGTSVSYPMPLFNFGETAIEGLDLIYDYYNDVK